MILTERDPEGWYKSCEESIFVNHTDHPNPHRTLGMEISLALSPIRTRFNRMLAAVFYDRLFDGRSDKEHLIM